MYGLKIVKILRMNSVVVVKIERNEYHINSPIDIHMNQVVSKINVYFQKVWLLSNNDNKQIYLSGLLLKISRLVL